MLSAEDAEACISVEFNPVRVGFSGGKDVWTRDVLNLGVSPARLVAKTRQRFELAGGVVRESCALQEVWVHPNGVNLRTSGGEVTAELMLDCMGNASPVVRQIRFAKTPDGVCLVVGR